MTTISNSGSSVDRFRVAKGKGKEKKDGSLNFRVHW